MPIDWFTVIAQVINFLILVWLLKRFLYKPILDAIDEREKGIASKLADADTKKAEAQHERDDYCHKNEVFDKDRADLLRKARDEATSERQRLLDEARKDADLLRVRFQESLRSEQNHLNEEIVRWTQMQVIAATRKTLDDLANVSLEEHMIEVFAQRLSELTDEDKSKMVAALKRSNDSVRVRSAFNLSVGQQSAVETAIKDIFGTVVHIQFETVAELVSGIELVMDGQNVAWSIEDYLATLETSLGQLLHADPTADTKLEPANTSGHEPGLMTSTAKVIP